LRRPFIWTSTPNPPTRKMVVKARTNGMCIMWWVILHDVQLFVTLRVRIRAQYETVEHLQIVTVIGFAVNRGLENVVPTFI